MNTVAINYHAAELAERTRVTQLHAEADSEVALFRSTQDYAHLQRANELRGQAHEATREVCRLHDLAKGARAA